MSMDFEEKVIEDRRFRLPRIWSNRQIKGLATHFTGDIVNISGWDDRDKEGGYYKGYFSKSSSYAISNYGGERGMTGVKGEIYLDLTKELPNELINRFDVCFNHTTLEHIFDVRKAFSVICTISRDIVFVVVPFSQCEHDGDGYGDFWRFTPSCLRLLYEENDLEVVYEAESPYRNASIYLVFVGSKHAERWRGVLPKYKRIEEAGEQIGKSNLRKVYYYLFKRGSDS